MEKTKTNEITREYLQTKCTFYVNYIQGDTEEYSYDALLNYLEFEFNYWHDFESDLLHNIVLNNKYDNEYVRDKYTDNDNHDGIASYYKILHSAFILYKNANFDVTVSDLYDCITNEAKYVLVEETNFRSFVRINENTKDNRNIGNDITQISINLKMLSKRHEEYHIIQEVYSYCFVRGKINVFFGVMEIYLNPSILTSYLDTNSKNEGEVYKNEAAILYLTKRMGLVNGYFGHPISENEIRQANYSIDSIHEKIEDERREIIQLKESLEQLDIERNNNYESWMHTRQENYNKKLEEFSNLISEHENNISNLEMTYEEKLKLEKPVEHWKLEAEKRGKGFKIWSCTAILLIIALTVMGYILIDIVYDVTINNSQTAKLIPFSFVLVSLITLFVYILRTVIKIAMSSKHLQTEYEQKAAYTYFYLSLLQDEKNHLENDDKSFILKTLFSQVDTGLIKNSDSKDIEAVINSLISK